MAKLCPLCNNKCQRGMERFFRYYNCGTCGTFYTRLFGKYIKKLDKNKTASYIYHNRVGKPDFVHCIGDENSFRKFKKFMLSKGLNKGVNYDFVTLRYVENWHPEAFSQKIDCILLALSKLSKFHGDIIKLEYKDEASIFLYKQDDTLKKDQLKKEKRAQRRFIEKYLYQNGYIEEYFNEDKKIEITLSPKAWERAYELEKLQSGNSNKDVFAVVPFSEKDKNIKEAVIKGIEKAGFFVSTADEIINSNQTAFNIFDIIKQCKFMVMDISEPDYGMYFEAGYASGLGKEIIICCKSGVKDKKYQNETEEKAYKPYFDITQKQILYWKDYEDLSDKLEKLLKDLYC